MGVTIAIENDKYEDFKDWDTFRQGYDTEFIEKIWNEVAIEKIQMCDDEEGEINDLAPERPFITEDLLELIDKWKIEENAKKRYYTLYNILKKYENYGIYISR